MLSSNPEPAPCPCNNEQRRELLDLLGYCAILESTLVFLGHGGILGSMIGTPKDVLIRG